MDRIVMATIGCS